MGQNKTTDQEVVLMAYLRPILRERLARLQELHKDDDAHNPFDAGHVKLVGVVEQLALNSGIAAGSIRRAIRDEHIEYVDLDYADRLCLAFGLFIEVELPEEAFANKLEVIRANREQTSMYRLIARCRGMVLGDGRRDPETFKRQLAYIGGIR